MSLTGAVQWLTVSTVGYVPLETKKKKLKSNKLFSTGRSTQRGRVFRIINTFLFCFTDPNTEHPLWDVFLSGVPDVGRVLFRSKHNTPSSIFLFNERGWQFAILFILLQDSLQNTRPMVDSIRIVVQQSVEAIVVYVIESWF